MAPSLRDLELFVAIIDAGSITAGARAVGVSLSSASSRIALLERQEGVELLSRRRGGIVPTAAGTTLAIHARALLERADELRQAMDGLRGDSAREIRLASNTSAVDTLTEFLAATLARFPTMRIAVVETSSVEVASRVREGGADLGIASLPPTGDALIARELWADPLVVVRGSVFRGDDVAPSFEEVMRGPLIGLPAANPLQTLIDEQARILGVSPAYRVRLPTLNAVYAVASTGAGAAIVPYGTVSRSPTLPAAIHPVAEEWADRRALLITRSTYVPSPAQQEFIDALLRYRDEVDVTEPLGVVIPDSPPERARRG